MLDSDSRWSEDNINSKNICATEAIIRVHNHYQREMTSSDSSHPMANIKAHPTKDFVDRVIMHPAFKPRPVVSASSYDPAVVNTIIGRFDDRVAGRDLNYGGMYDNNRGSGKPG
jgi:hypothetical protein